MPDFIGIAGVGSISLAAFCVSVFRSRGARFEAPFVLFSILALGRLAGELVAFAYARGVGRVLPFLPVECLPCLAFYPTFAGLLRFARKSYGGQGSDGRPGSNRMIAMAAPLMLYDALNCAMAFLAGSPAMSAVAAALPPVVLPASMAVLGATAMGLASASVLFPRRVAE